MVASSIVRRSVASALPPIALGRDIRKLDRVRKNYGHFYNPTNSNPIKAGRRRVPFQFKPSQAEDNIRNWNPFTEIKQSTASKQTPSVPKTAKPKSRGIFGGLFRNNWRSQKAWQTGENLGQPKVGKQGKALRVQQANLIREARGETIPRTTLGDRWNAFTNAQADNARQGGWLSNSVNDLSSRFKQFRQAQQARRDKSLRNEMYNRIREARVFNSYLNLAEFSRPRLTLGYF